MPHCSALNRCVLLWNTLHHSRTDWFNCRNNSCRSSASTRQQCIQWNLSQPFSRLLVQWNLYRVCKLWFINPYLTVSLYVLSTCTFIWICSHVINSGWSGFPSVLLAQDAIKLTGQYCYPTHCMLDTHVYLPDHLPSYVPLCQLCHRTATAIS